MEQASYQVARSISFLAILLLYSLLKLASLPFVILATLLQQGLWQMSNSLDDFHKEFFSGLAFIITKFFNDA